MIRITSVVAILNAISCLAVPAFAQTISIRTLALRAGDTAEVCVAKEKTYVPLEFSATQPSEAVEATAVNPLPLYQVKTDAKGQQVFVLSQKVKVPDGARGILLLCWQSGSKTCCVAIKDEFAAAKYNDWLLINASTRQIAFKVGEKTKPVVLNPGASVTHRISEEKEVGTAVLAQAPFDGEPKIFYSTYWPVYPDKRSLVLFVDDERKILVKRISDPLAPAGSSKKPG